MEKDVVIRMVEPKDAAEVCRICCEDLGYQCDKSLVKERILTLDVSREAVFIALVNDEVAGYVHVEKYNTLYFETMANILGTAVSSRYRKRGIGRALIERAEKWAEQNEIYLMRLNPGSNRAEAHLFYRRLGYGSEKEQLRFIKRIGDM